jgi:hypothetical protein
MPIRELTEEQAEQDFWRPYREQLKAERAWNDWHLFEWRDGSPRPPCPYPSLALMQKWEPTCKQNVTAI